MLVEKVYKTKIAVYAKKYGVNCDLFIKSILETLIHERSEWISVSSCMRIIPNSAFRILLNA